MRQKINRVKTRVFFSGIAIVFLIASGCGGSNYGRSIHGTVGGYSMANANPNPISVMVANKIPIPLYIVLDSAKVKDVWQLEKNACAVGTRGCERFKLMDVHQFVRRDLKSAMEHYFQDVKVIESVDALPDTEHVIGDVKIDDITLNGLDRGGLTYQIINMKWGFAMRRSTEQNYFYSFAGLAKSNDTYPTFEIGCTQLVENAIPAMIKKWAEDGFPSALRSSDQPVETPES